MRTIKNTLNCCVMWICEEAKRVGDGVAGKTENIYNLWFY